MGFSSPSGGFGHEELHSAPQFPLQGGNGKRKAIGGKSGRSWVTFIPFSVAALLQGHASVLLEGRCAGENKVPPENSPL